MEVRIRSCCCHLSTIVTAVVAVQTVCWLLLAVSAVIMVAWPHSHILSVALTIGLSPLRLSVTVLAVSFIGVLSNFILLAGIRTRLHFLLLPWMVTNAILVLGMFSVGAYFIIFFTMAKRKKDIVLAAISTLPILLSIFLVFIIVLVIKLFLEMKQKQLLVRVASSFRGSRASLNYRQKYIDGTPKSVRSMRSSDGFDDQIMNGMMNRYNTGIRTLSEMHDIDRSGKHLTHSRHFNSKPRQPPKFSSKSQPIYKSRSLEHILDSSTDESLYQEKYTKSLPRRPNKRKPRDQQTDTLRSSRSVNSVKSVSIHPRVVEYHYSHGKDIQPAHNDNKKVLEDLEMSDYSEGSVPAPIYPKQTMPTSGQIIDHYHDFVL